MQHLRGFQRYCNEGLTCLLLLFSMACTNNTSPQNVSNSTISENRIGGPKITEIKKSGSKKNAGFKVGHLEFKSTCWLNDYKECFSSSLTITFPEIDLYENEDFGKMINEDIELLFKDEIELFEKRKKECDKKPIDTSGFSIINAVTIVDVQKEYCSSSFLSFSFKWQYMDESAFAPYQNLESGLNYDLIKQKKIEFADLFNSGFEKKLSPLLVTNFFEFSDDKKPIYIDLTRSKELEFFIKKQAVGIMR